MTLAEEVKHTSILLKAGKIILYPTDTIWGVGCDATNQKAVQKMYKLKGRDAGKSMIILLDSAEKLKKYVKNVPPIAYDLIKNSASPLTIVYSGAQKVAKNLIAGDGTIAIRVVKGRYSGQVIKELDRPLVSTSANLSGQPTAITFDQISEELKDKVDYAVKHFREKTKSIRPSTVIKLEKDGKFTILRP